MDKEEYNKIPIVYCRECLHIKIRRFADDDGYCEDCTSTDLGEAPIGEWQELYKERYGHYFMEETNGRDFRILRTIKNK